MHTCVDGCEGVFAGALTGVHAYGQIHLHVCIDLRSLDFGVKHYKISLPVWAGEAPETCAQCFSERDMRGLPFVHLCDLPPDSHGEGLPLFYGVASWKYHPPLLHRGFPLLLA